MERATFERLLTYPASATVEEWELLRQERDRYPHCAPLQLLSLVADKVNGARLWEKQSLPIVSLYVQDREHVTRMIDRATQPKAPTAAISQPVETTPQTPVSDNATERPAKSVTDFKPADEDFDILREINDYQEVSFKTAPKSVILSNFLENDGGLVSEIDAYGDVKSNELSKNSVDDSRIVETETLAFILAGQGKLRQALAMYEKLILNNPEKSSTFATRIAEIKAQIEASDVTR